MGVRMLAAVLLALSASSAAAQAPATRQSPTPGQNQPAAPASGFWERSNLLDDPGGLRSALGEHGISLGLTETSEVLGNFTGGLRRGAIYEGATELGLGVDMEKAVGLKGGIFNVTAYQIHGRGLTLNDVEDLNTISSIEADRATRLFELWYQQSFADGAVDVRVGQMAAGQEFALSEYAGVFINSSFGWPTLFAVDLPSDGPDYPLAAPGLRVRARPDPTTTLLFGVFNGNAAGPGTGDPQLRNPSGANLRFQGVLVMAEAQFARNQEKDAAGLPGTVKLGGWYDSLVSESPDGPARAGRGGDWSFYGIIDQRVWRKPGSQDGGIGVFLRAMAAPPDRNLLVAFVDGGVTWKGVFGRDDDTVGLGVGWARLGPRAVARGAETVIELTYQAQVAPWWQLQPEFQVHRQSGRRDPEPRIGASRRQRRRARAADSGDVLVPAVS